MHQMFAFEGDLIEVRKHTTKINLRIKLHFLIRRYKNDRNQIVHGNFEDFNQKWKNFMYLSAIEEIVNCIQEYDVLYQIMKK
jgi:hypothetical protein